MGCWISGDEVFLELVKVAVLRIYGYARGCLISGLMSSLCFISINVFVGMYLLSVAVGIVKSEWVNS